MTTKNKSSINFNLSEIADGGLQEKFAKEVARIVQNIMDPNTDTKTKRKITIGLTYKSNDNRDAVDVLVEVKSNLAPQIGLNTTMLVGQDSITGELAANELKSGTPGQTYMDPDDGKTKTDSGIPVEEVEVKDKKIVDLQNKKA